MNIIKRLFDKDFFINIAMAITIGSTLWVSFAITPIVNAQPPDGSPYFNVTVEGIDQKRLDKCFDDAYSGPGTQLSSYCANAFQLYLMCKDMPGDRDTNCNTLFEGNLEDFEFIDKNEDYGMEKTDPVKTLDQQGKFSAISLPHVKLDSNQLGLLYTGVLITAGAIAVVFIVIGGIRYTLSQGDSQAITRAKNTILYALVGLVIVIFAFVIVRFVVGSIGSANSSGGNGNPIDSVNSGSDAGPGGSTGNSSDQAPSTGGGSSGNDSDSSGPGGSSNRKPGSSSGRNPGDSTGPDRFIPRPPRD